MNSLDGYRILRAVAETGSLAGAARALMISQPTASNHLNALEAQLGGRLVERGPVGSSLTALGSVVLPQARMLLERVGAVQRDVRAFTERETTIVHVGSFPSAAVHVLAGPLVSLVRCGGLFELFVAEPDELVARFGEKLFDVAVLVSEPGAPLPTPEWTESASLFDDPYLVLLPSGHPLLANDRVRIADLHREAWLTTSNDASPEYTLLCRSYGELGRRPRFAARTTDFGVNQRLVAAGLGVSLLPGLLAPTTIAGVEARPLADERFARRIHLAWRDCRSDPVSLLVAEVLERAEEGSLPGQTSGRRYEVRA